MFYYLCSFWIGPIGCVTSYIFKAIWFPPRKYLVKPVLGPSLAVRWKFLLRLHTEGLSVTLRWRTAIKAIFPLLCVCFFSYFAVNVPLLFHGWLPHILNFLSWRYILMTRRLNGQTKFSQDRQHRSLTCYKKTTAVVVNWWNDGQTEMNNPLPTLKNPGFYTDL